MANIDNLEDVRSVKSIDSRIRKTSRIEAVKVGGATILLELDEEFLTEEDDAVKVARSLETPTAMSEITVETVEISEIQIIDEEIKKKIAHHSPDIEPKDYTNDIVIKSDGKPDIIRDIINYKRESIFRYFNLFSHHLHLAFATPAIIRIPHLAHKYASSNGSAFFLVYLICLIFMVFPICVLETIMAQYSSLGPINIFADCLPLIKGVGFGMVLTCSLLMLITSTLLSWSALYLFLSTQSELPWTHCPSNATAECKEIDDAHQKSLKDLFIPSDYFFQMNIIKSLDVELGDPLELNVTLASILFVLWLLVLFFVSRHYVWQVKVITSSIAVITLCSFIALMINGLNLENSGRGLNEVFQMDSEDLRSDLAMPDMWLDCLGQLFWSLGPCIGFLLSRASYNKFRRKIVREVMLASVFNLFVQLLLMITIFSYAGHLYEHSVYKNLGYFFVIGSYAVSVDTLPSFSSFVLFFCVCKSLFSHIVMLADTVVITLTDSLPIPWRGGYKKFFIEFLICVFGFLGSLIFVTKDGIYYISTTDSLVPWIAGMSLGLMEISALVYIYGTDDIKRHFIEMQKSQTIHISICKYFVAPALMTILIWTSVSGIVEPLLWDHAVTSREDSYFKVGLTLALLPVALTLIILSSQIACNLMNLKSLCKPSSDWGSAVSRHRELLKKHNKRRDRRQPWLVIQGKSDEIVPENLSTWIPYGYSWLPNTPASKLLKERHSDINSLTRRALATLLLDRFSQRGQKQLMNHSGVLANAAIPQHFASLSISLDVRERKKPCIESTHLILEGSRT